MDQQKPLGLILARNFLTSLSTPAFLLETGGTLIFWNEAAGALLGMSFEEYGRRPAEEWGKALGPFDSQGDPIPLDDLPTTKVVRQGRPAHAQFTIHSVGGTEHEIEASAVPIVSEGVQEGAMVFFWSRNGGEA
jgi:PAS domain-containing protein